MDYLRIYFKDNGKYYGDFIMENRIDLISKLLRCLTKSQGVVITNIFDEFYMDTIGSYINKVCDLDIVNQIQKNKSFDSKPLKLCIDSNDENKILKKIESLLIDCKNIKLVYDIDELLECDDIEKEVKPIFIFTKTTRPIRQDCEMCNHYQYICEGESLCTKYREISKDELYSKVCLEKMQNDFNNNDFIIMRMFNDIDGMKRGFDYFNALLNNERYKSQRDEILKIIKDYEYASKLSDEEVNNLKLKYDFDNKMYNNFEFKDEHNKELKEYYYEKIEEKLNDIEELKKKGNIEKYVDEIKTLIYYDEDFLIMKESLDDEELLYCRKIEKELEKELDFYMKY